MDDFNVSSLHESKNEWSSRLVTVLTPLFIEGYRSILEESIQLCRENDEMEKYLMTFQNLISRIPKWNQTIIENECKRISEKSGCVYLEDLITCVHIIQLKILTSMRVGQKQKKIDINIPKLNDFVHKAYINVARKIYKNIYLYEQDVQPLQAQKNNREIEIIVQECILNTIRESIPVETILKAYMDETVEEDVTEEIKEEIIYEDVIKDAVTKINADSADLTTGSAVLTTVKDLTTGSQDKSRIQFNDIDYIKDSNNIVSQIQAPKTIERLEEISAIRNKERNEDDDDDDNSNEKLNISNVSVSLDALDIHNIEEPRMNLRLPDLLDDIEILS
jgi:hypothetical protein